MSAVNKIDGGNPSAASDKLCCDALAGKLRTEMAMHHPLLSGHVILPTPPVDELFKIIKRAVVLRETGCCFSARSGVGKTSALEMVDVMLRQQMPKLPVFRHDTHNQQIPSIRAFFKHFLATVGHSEKKGETYDLRERLVNCLIDDARISGMNMILLFIDEAHAMAVQDFNFLKDVYNDLGKENVQLITILMGQEPDLSKVIERLKNAGRLDLIGRFAMRPLSFRAYNSVQDLAAIFKGIDATSFPEASGISWTSFFFPEAYRCGFRLENEAPRFMAAISESAPGGASYFDFPARQTFLAIRTFVIDNAGSDESKIRLPENAWKEAVDYAKLQEAMLLMTARGQQGKVEMEI
jgi:hypothetical protein